MTITDEMVERARARYLDLVGKWIQPSLMEACLEAALPAAAPHDELERLRAGLKEIKEFAGTFGGAWASAQAGQWLDGQPKRHAATPHVPEGWQLVPKEPTQDMLGMLWETRDRCAAKNMTAGETYRLAYRDMLAAAPSPPAPAAGREGDKSLVEYWEKAWETQIADVLGEPGTAQTIIRLAKLNGLFDPFKGIAPAAGREAVLEEIVRALLTIRAENDRARQEFTNVSNNLIDAQLLIALTAIHAALASKPVPAGED